MPSIAHGQLSLNGSADRRVLIRRLKHLMMHTIPHTYNDALAIGAFILGPA